MRKRLLIALLAMLAVPTASGKELRPGDVLLCNKRVCQALRSRPALRELTTFLWVGPPPARAEPVRAGAPVLQLRRRDGYVYGVVGGARRNRIRLHGVNCDRFRRGRWYRVPATVAAEVRRMDGAVSPYALGRRIPRSC